MVNDESIEAVSDVKEETSLDSQLNKLLLQVENDLKKLKDETDEDLMDHLNDLKELKKIAVLTVIDIKHINWFLESAIFALMKEIPESFNIKLLALYKCMLNRIGDSTKEDYLKHNEKLLELKSKENDKLALLLLFKKELDKKINEEIEIKKQNPVQSFFHALNEQKRTLKETAYPSTSNKRIKLLPISPLALQSNGLPTQINYENPENLQSQRMKLS